MSNNIFFDQNECQLYSKNFSYKQLIVDKKKNSKRIIHSLLTVAKDK